MSPRKSESLIVYGNCQADAITSVLTKDSIVSSYYELAYYRSFDHPTDGRATFTEGLVDRCALLWEQHDREAFPLKDDLPKRAVTVRFPASDLNLLWPFNCVNPYNAPEPPVFPFGRYPYGDRVIVQAINRGLSREDVLSFYLERWDEYKVDLNRLFELETARINARDARCDVKIADFVFENFRKERLFWTVNHPGTRLLNELIERLLQASDRLNPALADADIVGTMASNYPPSGPLGVVGVPVHPMVAEHLRLEWYDPNECYRSWDGKTYSYLEYLQGMIDHAFRIREEGAMAPTRAQ